MNQINRGSFFMFSKTITMLAMAFVASASAAQADVTVQCKAVGFKTAQSGGRMLFTDSRLTFEVVGVTKSKQLVINSVRGEVKVGSDEHKNLDSENAYIGHFRFRQLRSDPTYRARKYKNFVRFKSFNAAETTGLETGMWGDFLLEKNIEDGMQAKYVFKAGDHMGGTMHFTCLVFE